MYVKFYSCNGSVLYWLLISRFYSSIPPDNTALRHLFAFHFIAMHVHDQPDNLSDISSDEHNVLEHTLNSRCETTIKLPLIGYLSLQNVMSNC